MLTWLKSLFGNPKIIIRVAVDSLDALVPTLTYEIKKIEDQFNAKTAAEKSQWIIDKVQEFLRKQFRLDV